MPAPRSQGRVPARVGRLALRQGANAARATADRIGDVIPLGQPVLRGHHSQRRHERGLARTIESGMRASFENSVKAAEMRARADNIEAAADLRRRAGMPSSA